MCLSRVPRGFEEERGVEGGAGDGADGVPGSVPCDRSAGGDSSRARGPEGRRGTSRKAVAFAR